MPKMKTHSGAKKRFIVTKSGKIKHKKMGMRHLLSGESPNHGRKMRKAAILENNETRAIKKFMPYEF